MCFHGSAILLDFAGKLDGAPNVTAVQVELWIEVLLGCDGRGVVRTGALRHVTLTKTQTRRDDGPSQTTVGECGRLNLTPL